MALERGAASHEAVEPKERDAFASEALLVADVLLVGVRAAREYIATEVRRAVGAAIRSRTRTVVASPGGKHSAAKTPPPRVAISEGAGAARGYRVWIFKGFEYAAAQRARQPF